MLKNSSPNSLFGRYHNVRDASAKALTLTILILATTACATVGPTYSPPSAPSLGAKDSWQISEAAKLNNRSAGVALIDWWKSFNDPLLLELIATAQTTSPSLAVALARIDGARSALRASESGAGPNANASTGVQRQKTAGSPGLSVAQIGIDAGWEIDLFGAVKRGNNAALAQLESSQADWHATHISLASEVANVYVALKTCEANQQIQKLDVSSQTKTLDLTQLKVKAGFSAPADASLLRASLANSRNQLTELETECATLINTLSLLTQISPETIAARSNAAAGALPKPRTFMVTTLPAQLLTQRPDLLALERQLAASSEQIGIAKANQLPRFTLSGNIGFSATRILGGTNDGLNWGFGPTLSLPIFDAGRRAAAVDGAQARYNEFEAQVQGRLQAAIAEVQEAMIRLNAAQAREANALNAVADFEAFYKAADTRWSVGVGSLLELEEARRLAANAKVGLLRLEQNRLTQSINLFKALGGGWDTQSLANTTSGAKK